MAKNNKIIIIIASVIVALALIFYFIILPIINKPEVEVKPDCRVYGNDWEAVKVTSEDIKNNSSLKLGDYYCCIGTSRISTGRCKKEDMNK